MTPRTMWTRLAGLLLVVVVLVAVVPSETVIVVARAVGLVACAALIWWYHRNADWKSSPIGRGTMAIKAGIFSIAVAANVRTLNDHVEANLYEFAHRSLAAGWLLLTVALVFRLVVMRRIQRGGGHVVTQIRPKEQP